MWERRRARERSAWRMMMLQGDWRGIAAARVWNTDSKESRGGRSRSGLPCQQAGNWESGMRVLRERW